MKKLIFALIVLVPLLTIETQVSAQNSKKESKKEKKAKRQQAVKQMLKDRNFVYHPTQATPMSGCTVQLDFSFSAKVHGDTLDSYMPYYGRAYHVDYGSNKGPFDFTLPIKDYKFEKVKDGYNVNFEVKKGQDNIKFNFHISENGFANLTIISTNRQSISYYGTVEKPAPENAG